MGSIGVRCSRNLHNLWFHLDTQFATSHLHPSFRTDNLEREVNNLLGIAPPWEQLTVVGASITRRVLKIRGVRCLSARPDYFDLEIKNEKRWPTILPQVVKIIREETNDLSASVVVRIGDQSVPPWHQPLLDRLFG